MPNSIWYERACKILDIESERLSNLYDHTVCKPCRAAINIERLELKYLREKLDRWKAYCDSRQDI